MFAGNSETNANSTAESIATAGGSTCRGGTANRSAYWVPALVDTTTGRPLTGKRFLLYYKAGYHGSVSKDIQAPPKGLRMIAGSATATQPQEDNGLVFWTCTNNDQRNMSIPADCSGQLKMSVTFPQFWNGKDLDSSDHKSHMAYSIWGKGCPDGYPVAIPEITFGVYYDVPKAGPASLRLASDAYSTDQPGGRSMHGDWMNGWDEGVMAAIIANCIRPGLDCHMDNLNNGTMLSSGPQWGANGGTNQ